MIKLTEMETEVLSAIAEGDFMDGLTGIASEGKEIWTDCIYQDEAIVPQTSLPGVVSSLKKKGLIKCYGDTISLTAQGVCQYWPDSDGGFI